MMRSALKFDPDKEGLRTLFREWQIQTLRILWDKPGEQFTTKQIWDIVSRKLERGVSRATIYHFLDEMKDKKVVAYETGTGRGGLRVLFYSEYTEVDFRELMAELLIQSVKDNLLAPRK